MLQYRAEFDATVVFSAGGGLHAQAFKVDVPHADPTEAQIAALFVAACRLSDVALVELRNVRVFAEPHLGIPAGPAQEPPRRWVELSHVIAEGLVTLPGLPAPAFTPHLTREASRDVYAPGTEFAIDLITMVGNTGTYLDSPFHRYADGKDLSQLELESLANLDCVVVRATSRSQRAISDLPGDVELRGKAVLFHTGWDAYWRTDEYFEGHPYLTGELAQRLVEAGAALVGIDSLNIDNTENGERPVHSTLLGADIPIVEHLRGLGALPDRGARFYAVPVKVKGMGTFPVRAFARF